MTTSQLQHHEYSHAKGVKCEDILDKDVTGAAFPFDTCDMDPTMPVLLGEGPHLSNIACACVTVRGPKLMLHDARSLRRRGDLTLYDGGKTEPRRTRAAIPTFLRCIASCFVQRCASEVERLRV